MHVYIHAYIHYMNVYIYIDYHALIYNIFMHTHDTHVYMYTYFQLNVCAPSARRHHSKPGPQARRPAGPLRVPGPQAPSGQQARPRPGPAGSDSMQAQLCPRPAGSQRPAASSRKAISSGPWALLLCHWPASCANTCYAYMYVCTRTCCKPMCASIKSNQTWPNIRKYTCASTFFNA